MKVSEGALPGMFRIRSASCLSSRFTVRASNCCCCCLMQSAHDLFHEAPGSTKGCLEEATSEPTTAPMCEIQFHRISIESCSEMSHLAEHAPPHRHGTTGTPYLAHPLRRVRQHAARPLPDSVSDATLGPLSATRHLLISEARSMRTVSAASRQLRSQAMPGELHVAHMTAGSLWTYPLGSSLPAPRAARQMPHNASF
eukprot:NODE_20990_length_774_cov_1.519320.p1 GENE.NODE_20990_length_774_cov_1.519320~~NODE_20990_length_774_cov_1.519320.p1  ORF type:complete len:198 (-),score=21.82 NODE_20990_length_774_cov_1.519320:46-639(-)